VGPRTVLDAVVKRKLPASAGTRTPIIQFVVQSYTTELSRLLKNKIRKIGFVAGNMRTLDPLFYIYKILFSSNLIVYFLTFRCKFSK
jgi:hypothetical protein